MALDTSTGIDPDIRAMLNLQGQQQGNLISLQLDHSQELQDLRAEFLGLKWDDNLEEYVKDPTKKPMMNDIGTNTVMSTLMPRTTKIFSLSKHKSEDIDNRCLRYINGLTLLLTRHKEDYDIDTYAMLDIIIDLCDDIFRATLRKSLEGWEGEGIRGTHQSQDVTQTIIENRPKPSVFGIPNVFKRKRGG